MGHVGMACTCDGMPRKCHAITRHAMSCHAGLHAVSWHAMSCQVACHAMAWQGKAWHGVACDGAPRSAPIQPSASPGVVQQAAVRLHIDHAIPASVGAEGVQSAAAPPKELPLRWRPRQGHTAWHWQLAACTKLHTKRGWPEHAVQPMVTTHHLRYAERTRSSRCG